MLVPVQLERGRIVIGDRHDRPGDLVKAVGTPKHRLSHSRKSKTHRGKRDNRYDLWEAAIPMRLLP
jgi:hypothetical protein